MGRLWRSRRGETIVRPLPADVYNFLPFLPFVISVSLRPDNGLSRRFPYGFRIGQLVVEVVRHDEIVNAPSSVFLSRLETVGPPRVDARFVGVEEAESVGEARIEKVGKLLAFLVGEAGIAAVGLRIFRSISWCATLKSPQAMTGFFFRSSMR